MDENQLKLKKLIEQLAAIRGRHTELVSVYIPAGFGLQKVVEQIRNEQGTASNIKSKQVRKNVMGSLEKILQHLKLYKETPANGLAVFCGNISEREGQDDLEIWAVEPAEPIKTRLYWCGQDFILDPLKEMVREREVYGLIVVDKSDANIGLLHGKRIETLKNLDSIVPGKTKAGGWCVHEDTLLQLPDGRIRKIKDIGEEQFLVCDPSTRSAIPGHHNHYFVRTAETAYRIDTHAPSLTITATPEHLFYILGSGGLSEKRVDELKSGDRLLAARRLPVRGTSQRLTVSPPSRIFLTPRGRRRLVAARQTRNLLQRDVARLLGVSQTFVSKCEKGEREWNRRHLDTLLRTYNIPPSALRTLVQEKPACSFPRRMTPPLARFIAYAFGDGCLEDQRLSLYDKDPSLLSCYLQDAKTLFGLQSSNTKREGRNYNEGRIGSSGLVTTLRTAFPELFTAENPTVPDIVCRSPAPVVAAFIGGLWDAEGYATFSNNSLGITMRDNGIITSLRLLLLRFGIMSSLKTVPQRNSFAVGPRYALVITDIVSLRNFARHIPLRSTHKQLTLQSLLPRVSALNRTHQIPISGSDIRKRVRSIRMNTEDFPHTQDFFIDKKGMSYAVFSRSILPAVRRRVRDIEHKQFQHPEDLRRFLRVHIRELACDLGISSSTFLWHREHNPEKLWIPLERRRREMLVAGNEMLRFFTTLLHSDLISVRVHRIQPVPATGKFYDMEVSPHPSFLANGLLVHNSQHRYERVRENLLNDFMKEVGEKASKYFKEQKDLKGVIVGGPGPIKEEFFKGAFLEYSIQKKVLGVVATTYTGESGLRELVDNSGDLLAATAAMHEKKILDRFFEELAKDSGLAVYGFKQVVEATRSGHLELVILSEAFDWREYSYSCTCGAGLKDYSRVGAREKTCPACGKPMAAKSDREVLDEVKKLAEQMGTNVEIVSTDSPRGEQLKELGGIAGILRYKL